MSETMEATVLFAATKRAERAEELASERMAAGRVSRPAMSERVFR
jgi:hypothetical protein